jgi:hypothetical protein
VQTFTVDPRRWWIGRLFAGNPLLRRSDRIEVLAVLAMVVVALAGIAVAGAVGTEVHDSERRADAVVARTRQLVSATVLEVGTVANFDGSEMPVVRARWTAGAAAHTDTFQWSGAVRPGDQIQIWVDSHGDRVHSAPLRPVLDALTVAVSIGAVAVMCSGTVLAVLRRCFDRAHDAQWEREIRHLVNEDGGRANGATPGTSS